MEFIPGAVDHGSSIGAACLSGRNWSTSGPRACHSRAKVSAPWSFFASIGFNLPLPFKFSSTPSPMALRKSWKTDFRLDIPVINGMLFSPVLVYATPGLAADRFAAWLSFDPALLS